MDSSYDLEFFDFQNVTDEEIKEIQYILKGPGNNGCVELPWDVPLKENSVEFQENESTVEGIGETSAVPFPAGEATLIGTVPASEGTAFVSLPTSVYPGAPPPYLVSRTLPYIRTYPPVGVPFFACPLPPGTSEAGPAAYAPPFLPLAAQAEGDAKGVTQCPKQQQTRNGRKKSESGELPQVSSAASVPIVPLPVHLAGYPPLQYGQSAAPTMYYVPVFNHHPYGGYLASHSAVLPVSMRPETPDDCPVATVDGPGPSSADFHDACEHLSSARVCVDANKCPTSSPTDADQRPAPSQTFDAVNCPASPQSCDADNCSASPETCDVDIGSASSQTFNADKSLSPLQTCDANRGPAPSQNRMADTGPAPSQNRMADTGPAPSQNRKADTGPASPQTCNADKGAASPQTCNADKGAASPQTFNADKGPAPLKTCDVDRGPASSQKCQGPPDTANNASPRRPEQRGGARECGSSSSLVYADSPARCWADLFKRPSHVNGIGKDMSNGTSYSSGFVEQ